MQICASNKQKTDWHINLPWVTMKTSQLLTAILARLIPALIVLSPTVFADELVTERHSNQNALNTSTRHWTIPPVSKQWGIPPRSMHWTIPPVSKQWGNPTRPMHWTIPRSANSIANPSESGYFSSSHGWTTEH